MGQGSSAREIYLSIEAGETQSIELFDFNSQDNKVVTHEVISNNSYICHDGENLTYPNKDDHIKLLYTVTFNEKTI